MYDLTESVGFGIEVAIPNGEYSLPREHSLACANEELPNAALFQLLFD